MPRRRRAGLSERQRQILDYIRQHARAHGYPPSVREIGTAVGLRSSSTVHAHLNTLERQGFIRRDPTKPRAIEILAPALDEPPAIQRRPTVAERSAMPEAVEGIAISRVPVVGQVAAGLPILAQENIEGYFPIPAQWGEEDEVFMLRVRGQSMVEAGILDGDMVVVKKQPSVEDGEIAVALVGDEATVKRIYREKGRIRLQPENSLMQPIYVKPNQPLSILGKVIAVVRRL